MVDFLAAEKAIDLIPDTVPRVDIRKEGDFYLEKAILITFDEQEYGIELLRAEITIFEDIFNNTMAGIIHFQDSSDLPQILPLIGEEKLKLRFTRPSEKGRGLLDEYYEMEFRVYKMDGRKPDDDKINIQNYTLHFTSSERIVDMKAKVWESYWDMPYSDIVEKVYSKYISKGKPIEVEKTKYEYKYMARGLSPFQIIGICGSKSISDEGNGSAYVFYEDMDKFNFVSIGKLMQQAPVEKYISQLANVLQEKKSFDRTIEDDVRKVEQYNFKSSFDIMRNLESGMYAQRLVSVDMLRQFHENVDWDYKKEFGSMPHLHDADVCTDALDALGSPPSVMKLALTTKDHDKVAHIVARDPTIKPNQVEEYLLKRASQMQQTNGNRMIISFSGDPRRKVGQVIEFLVPNHYGAVNEEHPPDPPHDRYMGGKFLITALKHRITASSYFCSAELMKDTLAQDIEGVDIIKHQDWTW